MSGLYDNTKWVWKDGNPVDVPIVGTLEDAARYYGSIYNKDGDGDLPPMINVQGMHGNQMMSMALSVMSEEASKRTKEELEKSDPESHAQAAKKLMVMMSELM